MMEKMCNWSIFEISIPYPFSCWTQARKVRSDDSVGITQILEHPRPWLLSPKDEEGVSW